MSVEEFREAVKKPGIAGMIGAATMLATLLGIQLVWPGTRLDAAEVGLRSAHLRVDTLRAQFENHVRAAAQTDTLIMTRFRPLYVGECLDRPSRETDLMGLGCDSLVVQPRRGNPR